MPCLVGFRKKSTRQETGNRPFFSNGLTLGPLRYRVKNCLLFAGKDILPYLPTLMQHLLAALSTAVTPHAKELAISAIGACANAAKKEIVPYFGQIIEQLKAFLAPAQDEDALKVGICKVAA